MSFHHLAVALGWVAVLVSFGGTAAQFQRIRRRGIEGVSLATWTLFVLMGCFWISYGVEQHSNVIIMGSLLVLPLQLGIVLRLQPWLRVSVVARSFSYATVFCVAPTLLWGWPGGVYGTGIAMVLNRAPQIAELARHRNASGVSVATWVLSVAGALLWMVFYLQARMWAAFASTGIAGVASLSIALLATWRHRQARVERRVPELIFAQG